MKIDFLIGDNPYGTTVHFAKGLAQALEALDVKTRLFWVADGHFYHAYYAILDDPPDWTCSFSDISLNGKSLAEMWQLPHLSMLVDPPIYFLHQLRGKNAWVSCVDQKDLHFVQKLGCQRSFFLPHGVDAALKTDIHKERPLDVVFFGTCIDFDALEGSWKKSEKELLQTACQRVLTPDGVSIAEALLEFKVSDQEFARLHYMVDQYVRGKERVELVRALKGHQIHIWGEGPWEKYAPNAILHAPINFDQIIEKMRQAKVVLNCSSRFKAGAHERIFYALMCGAMVYTADNEYINHILPELTTYRLGEWKNPTFSNWEEQACYGQQHILRDHTYHNRAQTLFEVLKEAH